MNADNQVLLFIPDDSESNISCIFFPFALCNSVTLKLGCASESPGRLVKTQIAGRQLHGFCLVSLGVGGLGSTCISNKCSGDGDTTGPGDHTLGITCLTCSFSKYGPQSLRSESPGNLAETQVCSLSENPRWRGGGCCALTHPTVYVIQYTTPFRSEVDLTPETTTTTTTTKTPSNSLMSVLTPKKEKAG